MDAKNGAPKRRNSKVKGRRVIFSPSLERTEFGVKLSQPERPASSRPRGRNGKKGRATRRGGGGGGGRDEGIDIGNGGGYIFQNIGYLRGKPVVCILTDRPVYGAQFISKSKVMAAGLRPMVFPPPPLVLDHPRPRRQVPAATTLKFQTNTKMAGPGPDMYCPTSRGDRRNGKCETRASPASFACISIGNDHPAIFKKNSR